MKKVISTIFLIALFFSAFLTTTYAENLKNIQIVKTDDNYLIYVEEMMNKSFQYAMSDKSDLSIDNIELNYLVSAKDKNDNYVALVEDNSKKYLYIKDGEELTNKEIEINKAASDKVLTEIAKLTEIIDTEITNIEVRNEAIGQVIHQEYIGGLKITEEGNAEYEYVATKLPSESYSNLKNLITKSMNNKNLNMYEKIDITTEMNSLYNKLIYNANSNNLWKKAEDKTIKQPEDAEKGDEYAVLIKKIENGTETYDIKFLVSDKRISETEFEQVEKVVKSTSKLPITYDTTITLFIALAVIIVAILFVLIFRHKINKKENK